MKKTTLYTAIAVCCFVLTGMHAQAQSNCLKLPNGEWVLPDGVTPCPNAIITAVPFLRIVADARSGAMGDAGIGLSPDANAIHFNASKLVFADKDLGLSASYTPWLRNLGLNDVYLADLSAYKKIDELQSVGFNLRYFNLGDIPFTDFNGEPLGNGRPREFAINAAYARKLSDNFSAAISAKFIYSNLASGQTVNGQDIEVGTAGAADFSFTYQTELKNGDTPSDLLVGVAITNVGSKITYTNAASNERDFIPTNLGIGAGWTLHLDQYNALTIAADMNKLLVPTRCFEDCDQDQNNIPDWKEQGPIQGIFSSFSDAPGGFSEELKELMWSFGVEYWYDQQFAVRAGYYYENVIKGNRKYFTVGLGLKYNVFGLNFSYLVPTTNQRNPLDNTLRFTLLFDFGALEP